MWLVFHVWLEPIQPVEEAFSGATITQKYLLLKPASSRYLPYLSFMCQKLVEMMDCFSIHAEYASYLGLVALWRFSKKGWRRTQKLEEHTKKKENSHFLKYCYGFSFSIGGFMVVFRSSFNTIIITIKKNGGSY